MKYQLLWTACVIGLLQLSVVTCRRAHDKVTNKENEEYSTTVSPPVAYTGQEIERALNSSDKLALDPGPMLHGDLNYYHEDEFNWGMFIVILFSCFLVLSLFCGCILACCRRKNIQAGRILSRQTFETPSEAQFLQPSPVYNQPQNYQQQNYQQQYYQQQNYLQQYYQQQNYQQQNYQQQNFSTEEDLPPPYHAIQQHQPQSLVVSQYQPEHQLPRLHQGRQEQNFPPTLQAEASQDPSVVEFENPISGVDQPEKAPLIKY